MRASCSGSIPTPNPGGAFVDVKINAVEVLKRQLRRATPGEVFVSSACDAWQPVEAPWGLSRHCCELLLERDFQVNVLTKSARVLDDLEVFRGRCARIGTTVTTLDEDLCRLWEPGALSVAERLRIVDTARRAGLSTTIMFGPLLPWLSDDEASLAAMFRARRNWTCKPSGSMRLTRGPASGRRWLPCWRPVFPSCASGIAACSSTATRVPPISPI